MTVPWSLMKLILLHLCCEEMAFIETFLSYRVAGLDVTSNRASSAMARRRAVLCLHPASGWVRKGLAECVSVRGKQWAACWKHFQGNTFKKWTRGSCSQHVECHQLQYCAVQEGEGTLTWPVCNPADKSTDTQTHTALMNHRSHTECTQDGRTYEGQWASALSRTWRTMHWSWALQDTS